MRYASVGVFFSNIVRTTVYSDPAIHISPPPVSVASYQVLLQVTFLFAAATKPERNGTRNEPFLYLPA